MVHNIYQMAATLPAALAMATSGSLTGLAFLGKVLAFTAVIGGSIFIPSSTVVSNVHSITLKNGEIYKVTELTDDLLYECKQNGLFYLAVVMNGKVYISTVSVSYITAVYALTTGISVYNFYSENAYQVAKDAKGGLLPQFGPSHHIDKDTPSGIYYDHWHVSEHRGSGHAFFGMPYIKI